MVMNVELAVPHDVLAAETDRLLDFGRAFPHPDGGAAWLDALGQPDLSRPVFTWITARMTHVYCLGHRLGRPGDGELAAQGLSGLRGRLRDPGAGGWFTSLDAAGQSPDEKACYTHAFVVLAASSARMAGLPGADDLLEESLSLWQGRFFDPAAGLFLDAWDRAFDRADPYRGVNSNMHSVEALLAAADATGDAGLREQALGIARRVALDFARPQDWRIPEHFDPDWHPQLDHNIDQRDHPFQPYGATVGHGLEWSRLLLHLEASLGDHAPEWLLSSSVALFDRAAADGWAVDGADGFIYTTDWQGRPVVRDRMHWVLAEGFAAAEALHRRTGEKRYADLARAWWAYAERCLIDREHGSWHHQLDADNRVIDTVWPGKPDLYHAVQATLLPRLPLRLSLAAALAAGPPAT
ncbi:MAG TPA: AGE family epimerase/isomerase [Propionibacteriaceae bacterium]|nr:AGE family epimerase/isomerase [Propionibacteriaceae bacterium]